MNEEIKKLTYELRGDIAKLQLVLIQCRQLYRNPKNLSILNSTAGLFFQLVEIEFVDSLMLGICRLTENEYVSHERNLNLRTICNLIQDENLKSEVFDLCEKAKKISKFARDHRDKRIAHSDFDIRTNKGSKLLKDATFDKIEKSLKAIEDVINLVLGRLFGEIISSEFINLQGSADRLIGVLREYHKTE